MRDISERKKNEKIILQNQKMLAEAQRIANVGSWKLDLKTKLVTWSKQTYKIFGLKKYDKQVTLDYFFSFVHPEDKEYVQEVLNGALVTKLLKNFECRIVRPDSKIINLLGEGEIILDEDGNPLRMVGSVKDITEQKEAEIEIKKLNTELEARIMERTSQLQKVNDELEGFAYSVSHDLRAPLRHIDGFLSLMYANIEQDSEVIDGYYQKISEASKRMAVMIDALLRFSRLGRANLKLEPVNIHQLINEIINQEKIKYQQRKIIWKVNDLPIVPGDSELLRIAFENIIHNSIKYTTKRSEAKIEVGICTKKNKKVCIFFKDNGIGFNMDYKKKLFGVFQTLHSSDDYGGVGIGLAIANQIITKHNGAIDAISELDEGAIFYVTLPLIDLE